MCTFPTKIQRNHRRFKKIPEGNSNFVIACRRRQKNRSVMSLPFVYFHNRILFILHCDKTDNPSTAVQPAARGIVDTVEV